MKTSIIYILVVLLWPAILFSQKKTVQPANSNSTAAKTQAPVKSSTIEAKAQVPVTTNTPPMNAPPPVTTNTDASNTDPKEYIQAIRNRMQHAWDNGQTEEVINIVDLEIPGCSTQPDSNFCKASIWFTGGYLFQTGFEEGDSLAQQFMNIAKSYYSRVINILPGNQNALSNYLRLYEESDSVDFAIQQLKELADRFPQQRFNYLLRIGDLYVQQKNPKDANQYYQQAYAEDPWSEAACSRIVNLYAQYGIVPHAPGKKSSPNAINEFIYSCQDVGLANFGEEMGREQILLGLNNTSMTADKMILNILIWGDILAENNWLDKNRIEDLRSGIDINSVSQKDLAVQTDAMLAAYSRMAAAQSLDQMDPDESWLKTYPSYQRYDRDPVSPMSVYIKILKVKGEKAYFDGDMKSAEQFWQKGFQTAGSDNILFTELGKELAQLYAGVPDLDPKGEKMKSLVKSLFDGKMLSYGSGNYEMIREYHTVLGSIFYDQKRFSSDWYDNAEFQLSHALSPDLGPIINPEMRKMLAYVYEFNGKPESMMEENILAIQDLLRLDRMEEANIMIHETEQKTVGLDQKYVYQLGALDGIRKLRSTCADPEGISFQNQNDVYQFLIERQNQEEQHTKVLDQAFVKEQYFKALSDQGENIPNDQPVWQQQVYSQALIRIADQSQLGSYDDYTRLQHIRQSLASTMINPEQLTTTRFNKEVKSQYKEPNSEEEYKSFVIPTMGQQIQIPQSMFKLNETVTEYYKAPPEDATPTKMMPRIHYEEKTYKVIKPSENPKAEVQDPMKYQIIPQHQVQKNILNEKKVINSQYYKG